MKQTPPPEMFCITPFWVASMAKAGSSLTALQDIAQFSETRQKERLSRMTEARSAELLIGMVAGPAENTRRSELFFGRRAPLS